MHEWALAEAVVEYLYKRFYDKRVTGIKVGVGELQNIDIDIFLYSLRELMRSRGLGNIEVSVEKMETRLRCRVCGHIWRLDAGELGEEVSEIIHFVPEAIHTYTRCPRCGSRDFEIVSGRGVVIEEVVYEE